MQCNTMRMGDPSKQMYICPSLNSIIYRFNIFDSFDRMTWSHYSFWINKKKGNWCLVPPQHLQNVMTLWFYCVMSIFLLFFFFFCYFFNESKNYINWNAIFRSTNHFIIIRTVDLVNADEKILLPTTKANKKFI